MREKYKRFFKEDTSENLKHDILDKPLEYRYQMLDRFKQDANYYFKNPHPKHLWAGDPIEHADNMIALYKTFRGNEKPEWLTVLELKSYVNKLKSHK
jgi:hypothetical protein